MRDPRVVVVILGWVLCTEATAQVVGVGPGGAATHIEADEFDGVAFAIGASLIPHLSGEAFEGVSHGWGLVGSVSAAFGSGHVAQVAVARTWYSDDFANRLARSWDATLQTLWRWKRDNTGIEVGPALGYAWLSREFFEEKTGGLVVGGTAAATRAVGERLAVWAAVEGRWYQFKSLPIAGGPSDPDRESLGFQARIGLGVAYWH